MEDHTNTSRLAVTAAFSRGMPNFGVSPARPAVDGEVAVYHGMPHGLRDALRRRVVPGLFVDTTSVLETKRQALAAHRSQKEWLDVSQGMDSYLQTMEEMSLALGQASGKFQHAEGWRRHSRDRPVETRAWPSGLGQRRLRRRSRLGATPTQATMSRTRLSFSSAVWSSFAAMADCSRDFTRNCAASAGSAVNDCLKSLQADWNNFCAEIWTPATCIITLIVGMSRKN